MRVLITGGNGILGQKLVLKLQAAGYDLRLLARRREKVSPRTSADILTGDLLDKTSLRAAVRGVDAVIHLAGLTHAHKPELYYEVNTLGTKNLLEACRESQARRFIFISSRTAGLNGGAYARSKFLAEEEVIKSGLDWVILRLAEVYGAAENEAVSKLIRIIKFSYLIPIIGDGKYRLAPIFLDDALEAILGALKDPAINKKIYNLAGPEELTYNELVDQILEETNLKRMKIFLPVVLVEMILKIFSLIGINVFVPDQMPRLLSAKSADISQAAKDLNFRPRSFKAGLKELLNGKQ